MSSHRDASSVLVMVALGAACQSASPRALPPPVDAPTVDGLVADAAGTVDASDAATIDGAIDSGIDGGIDAAIDAGIDAPVDAMPDPRPDLTLFHALMLESIHVTVESFSPDSCVLGECLAAPGTRTLLRFDTVVVNSGTADLVLGPPDPNTPSWEYDSCHMHYHYLDFASYELLDSDGEVAAAGHKQSFCLRDDLAVDATAPSNGYDCTNQGLSVGWADVYAAELDCQFIDITGVPAGTYQLKVEVNELRTIIESRYDNNVALFTVVLP